jgi:hypothetical protein
MFEEKRISTHSALSLNKRFCKCFENLMNIFMVNDSISEYFAFEIKGLEYILSKLGFLKISKANLDQKIINSVNFLPE